MSAVIPAEIAAKFKAAYDWLKSEQFPSIGDPSGSGIYRTPDGGWQCNYANWCAVTIRPGETEPKETHGAICARWYQEGGAFDETGKPGWLGYPVSPEEVYNGDGDSSDRISHFENGDVIWTANKDETRIVNIKDKKRWYKFKHDQLLELLREAVEAPAPERHNEALRAVDEKCREDQFDVVLLGEFQYGKSTTFDTLCGGREMSPQGEGTTPTSAVPVSVQSLGRDESDEWGEIRFKSKRELAAEIFDTFESELSDPESNHELKRFLRDDSGQARNRFCDGFDIDDPEHLTAVRSALEDAWARYNRDGTSKFEFSTRQRQLMEVTTLIVRFYDTDEYRTMLKTTHFGVDDIGSYVWFPSDWSQNASKGFGYDVSFEDTRFAFVDAAILHLRSPFLEELGCRVTDCPGLDASAYDKEVTRRALLKADGVLFVHRCTKMVGASTLGELFEFVRDTGRTDKTILALNLWGISRNVAIVPGTDRRGRTTPSIVGASEQQIRNEGYDFPVVWCHALLAYLAALGERSLRAGVSFTSDERRWLAKKADVVEEGQTDESLWLAVVTATNSRFKIPELSDLSSLDEHTVSIVRNVSNFNKLIVAVSETVLREKAESILVANGSQKALETLRGHEYELGLKVEEATRAEQQCAAEVAAARQDLDEYDEDVKKALAESQFVKSKDDAVQLLARALVDDTLSDQFYEGLSHRIAKTVKILNGEWGGNSHEGFMQRLRAEVGPMIAEYFADYGVGTLNDWRNHPKGRWKVFINDEFDLNEKIQELGASRFEGKRLFDNVPIPAFPESLDVSAIPEQIQGSLGGLETVAEELREGLLSQLLNAFTWIPRKILGWLGFVRSDEQIDEQILADYAGSIRPKLEEAFRNNQVREILERGLLPVFSETHKQTLDALNSAKAAYRVKIMARCDELIELHRASNEERNRVAEESRKLCEGIIAPLRVRIEKFEQTVKSTAVEKNDSILVYN